MSRSLPLALVSALALLGGCTAPDGKALQKIACEQAAASIDMQSVGQLDALRKALGVAPGVDPIRHCETLGANMKHQSTGEPGAAQSDGNPPEEGQQGGPTKD